MQTGRVPADRPRGHQSADGLDRLRRHEAAASSTAQASLDGGFAAARTAYDGGWAGYLGSLKPVPASASGWSTEWKVSAMVLAASEDKTVPRRLRRGTQPGLGLVELAAVPGRLPRGLVARPLPDRHRAAGDRRRRGGEPRAGLPVDGAAARRRLVPAELAAGRHAGVRRPADGRGRVPDRAGAPARPHRRRGLGAREEVGGLRRRARPADAAGALGERRPATRRPPSRPRSPAWSARRTSPRRTATARRRRPTWRRPTSGSRASESMTATTTGPLQLVAVLPARHEERAPGLRRP